MRTASMILGIVGGVFALMLGAILMFGGYMAVYFMPKIGNTFPQNEITVNGEVVEFDMEEILEAGKSGSVQFLVRGVVILVFGILSIVGGALAKKKNVLAGIFMLVSCVLCFATFFGFIVAIFMLLGGIFALVRENKPPSNVITTVQ